MELQFGGFPLPGCDGGFSVLEEGVEPDEEAVGRVPAVRDVEAQGSGVDLLGDGNAKKVPPVSALICQDAMRNRIAD